MIETALMCLALNIYFEARSEPIQGQIAIAEVTLNRVASSDFPNDICGVVLQENKDGCQFSWWCDGKSDYPKEHNSLRTSKAIAKLMLEEGEYISVVGENATHYHNDEVYPYWADHLQRIRRIGKHIFYKEKSEEWLRPLARPYNLFK
jgi:spore germination cell wall hydrolase CwlJ-like protein|tara:strand:- start:532 stop:975 length:444 start_codon:yes stop_codon:yes gene_type:complete